MKTINIEIDKDQFIQIIRKLNDNEKLEIFDELKKTLFLKRFNNLLKKNKTIALNLDEITNEVEIVRKKRYEEGKQEI